MKRYNGENSKNRDDLNDEQLDEEFIFIEEGDEDDSDYSLEEDFDESDEDFDDEDFESDFDDSVMLSLIDTASMNATDLAKLVIENSYRNGERLEEEDIYRIYSEAFTNIMASAIAHKV